MERDASAFARERKEMRESYDKDAKAMKRQIELLQVRVRACACRVPSYGKLTDGTGV